MDIKELCYNLIKNYALDKANILKTCYLKILALFLTYMLFFNTSLLILRHVTLIFLLMIAGNGPRKGSTILLPKQIANVP